MLKKEEKEYSLTRQHCFYLGGKSCDEVEKADERHRIGKIKEGHLRIGLVGLLTRSKFG